MEALLFADWCVIKGVWKTYVIPALAIIAVATFTGFNWELDANTMATHIQNVAVSAGVLMLTLFGYFAFFGNDEREGWEAMRLSLPVTRRTVVRSRYVTLVCWVLVVTACLNVLGFAIEAVITQVVCGHVGVADVQETLLLNATIIAIYLVYISIMTPVFFKLGMARARTYYSLPFLACLLFALDPVQDFADSVLARVQDLVAALGSPWPLVAAAFVVALGIYALSSLISERVYAGREL